MGARKTIRRILIATIWMAVGGGLFTLLLAANSNKKKQVCSGYDIQVKSDFESPVIAKTEVLQWIKSVARGGIIDQSLASLDIHAMEELVEKNPWVKDAELWFDNRNRMHVVVEERKPLARMFTTSSGSFYLDADLHRLPLKKGWTAELPVFTSWPDQNKWSRKDSLLGMDVIALAKFIGENPFWSAQVEQIDINEGKQFELIPLVGNNVIRLGDGQDLDSKFNRLDVFYQQVLSKTGFEKYSTIDVRFKGQIIGQKNANN